MLKEKSLKLNDMVGVRGIAEFMKRVDFQDIQGSVKSLTVRVCSHLKQKNCNILVGVFSENELGVE